MKKTLALLLTLALLATALVGCGNKDNPPYNDPDQPPSSSNGDSTPDGNETVGGDETTDGNETTSGDETTEGDETTGGNEATYSEGLVFTLSEDQSSYMLSSVGTCRDSEIIIPATYGNLPVTVIKSYTFENCDWLTKVTIPNSVVEIEGSAFYNCPQLDKLIIPESVTKLDGGCIHNCPNAVEVQDGVTYVDNWLLYCDQTIANVTIRNNTVGIVSLSCEQITDIVIPNSVKYIMGSAFRNSISLETITIPDSVISIGDYTFEFCSSLKSIDIPYGVISIGSHAFAECTSLESVNMPDSVTYLGIGAFSNCHALKTLKLSNALTQILEYTFDGCEALEAIDLPDGLISIGERAFYCCGVQSTNDTVVEIPETVTMIGEDAFVGVQLLKFANGEMIIPDCAYQGSSITSLVVAEGTTEIGSHAFEHAEFLEWIYLPKTLSKIGSYAFNYCYAGAIYYNGSYDEFYAIEVGTANDGLFSYVVERYFYSEEKPTEEGNLYWHYVDGVPTPW